MLIRTHMVVWHDGCARWVWSWLTPEQWSKLRHIGHALVFWPCVGGPPTAVLLTPTPIQETINPHSPRAGLPAQGPTEAAYGPTPYAGIIPASSDHRRSVRGNVADTPEPGTLVVLLTAIGGVLVVRRRR